ncbi:MAG: hypothetical protein P1U89_15345 [Verrucomicrobiales bacterium]|nr:hypothetical protein [Verrucomicrobiales bacterium]
MKSKYLFIVAVLFVALFAAIFFVGFKGVFYLKEKQTGEGLIPDPPVESISR